MEIKFYDQVDEGLLKFVVIITLYQGKYVLCKHKDRSTYEIPGGHIEQDEMPFEAAKRELIEETGAVKFSLRPLCIYAVKRSEVDESYGMLYFAEIETLEFELKYEIEQLIFMDDLEEVQWTYPRIQPRLIETIRKQGLI